MRADRPADRKTRNNAKFDSHPRSSIEAFPVLSWRPRAPRPQPCGKGPRRAGWIRFLGKYQVGIGKNGTKKIVENEETERTRCILRRF